MRTSAFRLDDPSFSAGYPVGQGEAGASGSARAAREARTRPPGMPGCAVQSSNMSYEAAVLFGEFEQICKQMLLGILNEAMAANLSESTLIQLGAGMADLSLTSSQKRCSTEKSHRGPPTSGML